jgi:hypothetical protein
MDDVEARAVLASHLASHRARTFAELAALVGQVSCVEDRGPSGTPYQVEIEIRWDSPRERDAIRVFGAIDDGHLPGALAAPISDSFIVR